MANGGIGAGAFMDGFYKGYSLMKDIELKKAEQTRKENEANQKLIDAGKELDTAQGNENIKYNKLMTDLNQEKDKYLKDGNIDGYNSIVRSQIYATQDYDAKFKKYNADTRGKGTAAYISMSNDTTGALVEKDFYEVDGKKYLVKKEEKEIINNYVGDNKNLIGIGEDGRLNLYMKDAEGKKIEGSVYSSWDEFKGEGLAKGMLSKDQLSQEVIDYLNINDKDGKFDFSKGISKATKDLVERQLTGANYGSTEKERQVLNTIKLPSFQEKYKDKPIAEQKSIAMKLIDPKGYSEELLLKFQINSEGKDMRQVANLYTALSSEDKQMILKAQKDSPEYKEFVKNVSGSANGILSMQSKVGKLEKMIEKGDLKFGLVENQIAKFLSMTQEDWGIMSEDERRKAMSNVLGQGVVSDIYFTYLNKVNKGAPSDKDAEIMKTVVQGLSQGNTETVMNSLYQFMDSAQKETLNNYHTYSASAISVANSEYRSLSNYKDYSGGYISKGKDINTKTTITKGKETSTTTKTNKEPKYKVDGTLPNGTKVYLDENNKPFIYNTDGSKRYMKTKK